MPYKSTPDIDHDPTACWMCEPCYQQTGVANSNQTYGWGKTFNESKYGTVSHESKYCCFCGQVADQTLALWLDGQNRPEWSEVKGLLDHRERHQKQPPAPRIFPEIEALHELMEALNVSG